MKSILFLIPTLGGGGAERVLVNLVNNLDRSKYDVTIQTLFIAGTNAQYLHPDVHFIEGKVKIFRGNSPLMTLFSPSLLYRFIIKKRYDIVVSYLEGATARIVAGCPFKDSKLVSWVHVEQHNHKRASDSYRSFRESKRCNAKYDKIVCVAESVRKDFLKIYPNTDNCIVLYNTIDDEMIRRLSKEFLSPNTFSSEINVISIGRLVPEKGYDRLIHVHRKLIDKGCKHHLYIIGEGRQKTDLEQIIATESVNSTCHLIGFKENPYKYLAKADLFVCSSYREGFSSAVTEALILGVPVVTTNCSGSYELCGQNNEYGIVVENSNDGIFSGLYQILSDSSLIAHYKEMAKKRSVQFSKSSTVQAVENMLDNL